MGAVLFALPVFIIGLLQPRRYLFIGWILAGLQGVYIGYWSIHEAYFEGGFSEAVWGELGGIWVANSIFSSTSPLLLMAVAHWLCKKWPRVREIKEPLEEERDHTELLHIWR